MTNRRASAPVVSVLVAVAAGSLWSCGGPQDRVTTPVAVQSAGEESGSVTSSAARRITVCHKGKDLQVPTQALAIHVGHGDSIGSCQAASVCPCFTAAGIAELAALGAPFTRGACAGTSPYSLTLVYDTASTSSQMGTFEAPVGTGTCSVTSWDTGNPVVAVAAVTQAQFEACKQAIVGSSYYPAGCPQ
jgi:hypothetical protein